MLRSGARWRDFVRLIYGPYTTIYNRFNRWSRQGFGAGVFYALTGKTDVVTGAIDATYVKAHHSTAGAKRGRFDNAIGALARRTNDQDPRADRRSGSAQGHGSDREQHSRPGRRRRGAPARARRPANSWRIEPTTSENCQRLARRTRLRAGDPANPTRKHPHAYDPVAYRSRNTIEQMFCRPPKTSAASRPDTTSEQTTSCQLSYSPPPSHGGCRLSPDLRAGRR